MEFQIPQMLRNPLVAEGLLASQGHRSTELVRPYTKFMILLCT
jgi:hypothetical protein